MKNKKVLIYTVSIIVCQVAGLIGAIFTTSAIPGWYANLVKPSFNPPNWIFSPVWTVLYTLMGISVSRIWLSPKNDLRKRGLEVFILQLVLNASWSIIFFGLKNILMALLEILIMWISILITIIKFWRIDKKAAYLLFPYILWVSFATTLNLSIFLLN